jgi:hypothetical protein
MQTKFVKGGNIMGELGKLDKVFHIIMKRMVETGQAPHYTEIAAELGLSPDEGRKVIHELFSIPLISWLAASQYRHHRLLPSL